MKATIHPNHIPRVRRWQGKELFPQGEFELYKRDAGPVPDCLRRLCPALGREGIEYVVIGSAAMAGYGYPRVAGDLDVCVRTEGLDRFRERLVGTLYHSVEGRSRLFYDPQTQVALDFFISGELAGRRDRNKVIRFPDPSEARDISGVRTVALPRLVELLLSMGRFRDLGDVVELSRGNKLNLAFAGEVEETLRPVLLECFEQASDEWFEGPQLGGTRPTDAE